MIGSMSIKPFAVTCLFLALSFGSDAMASRGDVFEQNLRKAQQGDAAAQYIVGKAYAEGRGVARNRVEAAAWFKKAAEQGNASAQSDFGECCLMGKGVDANPFQAVEWFHKSAKQGNADAEAFLYGLAWFHFPAVPADYTNSGTQLRTLAARGNPVAQSFMGMACAKGLGVTQDYGQAVRWFRKAAEKGKPEPQGFLAFAYLRGKGVTTNYAQAAKWSRKAAEQDDAMGQAVLGVCYQDGKGVRKDPLEAVKWFRKAAKQGNNLAEASLGSAYRDGHGVTRDYVEAYKWFDRAASGGNTSAVSARDELISLMTPEQLAAAEVSPRRGLTHFDRRIIDAHEQRYTMSCIPSAVEMVLKLLGRVPGSYYEQQDAWKEKADGSFHDFDGKKIAGVTFHSDFWQPHNSEFPLARLFEAIDRELKAGRFVIIGLPAAGDTHDWVIYDEDADGDFLAISKAQGTIELKHVKKIIIDMHGTDIGTYEVEKEHN